MKIEHAKVFRIGLLTLALLLSIGTVGCSSKTVSGKNESNLLESSGIQNSFKVGDSFKVELKGNASTGYSWNYTVDNEGIFELSSSNEVPDKKDVPGSESSFTWSFKALKAGEVKLVYKYYRSWEGEASVTNDNIIEYLVTVEP